MIYFDNIGNEINIGDQVLILVPKSDASYRRGIIKNIRPHGSIYCEVLVEYDDGRLYCNTKRFNQHNCANIKFISKKTSAWRFNSDIIKFKKEYLEDY